MGLDVYSGTLTRYYTHHWKTKAQQYAESHGLKFQTILFQSRGRRFIC